MSDIFDHAGDAMDDLMSGRTADEGYMRYLPSPAKSKTCRDCKKTGLRWGKVKGSRWRLFDGNTEHVCAYKLNPNV